METGLTGMYSEHIKNLCADGLGGQPLIIATNRGPLEHHTGTDGNIEVDGTILETFAQEEAARAIEKAVAETVKAGIGTQDIFPNERYTTSDVAAAIVTPSSFGKVY